MTDTSIKVPVTWAGTRVDRFLSESDPRMTRSQYHRLIKSEQVLVSGVGVKPGYRLKGGEEISIHFPKPEVSRLMPEPISLNIVYEDDSVIVINKQAGMVVHPGAGNRSGTLVNALLNHCTDLKGVGGVERPGIVHRLDKDTSGLLVVAKDDFSHGALSRQLKERRVSRVYVAIVKHRVRDFTGTICEPIGRHPVNRKKMSIHSKAGRPSRTIFKVLERVDGYTFLELTLETGRTHQIRVHLTSIGHPILGDKVYGRGNKISHIHRQALHARGLEFTHPKTGKRLSFLSPLPEDFAYCLKMLKMENTLNVL